MNISAVLNISAMLTVALRFTALASALISVYLSPVTATDVTSSSARVGINEYTEVVISPAEGSPTSDLFNTCLTASRTMKIALFTVESDSGVEYQRHVPSTDIPNWETPEGSIEDIYQCADAAANADSSFRSHYGMFQYVDGVCKIHEYRYDLTLTATCGDESRLPVYTVTAWPACPLPALFVDIGEGTTCLYPTVQPGGIATYDATACQDTYTPSPVDLNSISDVQALLLQYYKPATDLFLLSYWDEGKSAWKYTSSVSVGEGLMEGGLPNGGPGTDDYVHLYMAANDSFKVHAAKAGFKAGFACMINGV